MRFVGARRLRGSVHAHPGVRNCSSLRVSTRIRHVLGNFDYVSRIPRHDLTNIVVKRIARLARDRRLTRSASGRVARSSACAALRRLAATGVDLHSTAFLEDGLKVWGQAVREGASVHFGPLLRRVVPRRGRRSLDPGGRHCPLFPKESFKGGRCRRFGHRERGAFARPGKHSAGAPEADGGAPRRVSAFVDLFKSKGSWPSTWRAGRRRGRRATPSSSTLSGR